MLRLWRVVHVCGGAIVVWVYVFRRRTTVSESGLGSGGPAELVGSLHHLVSPLSIATTDCLGDVEVKLQGCFCHDLEMSLFESSDGFRRRVLVIL